MDSTFVAPQGMKEIKAPIQVKFETIGTTLAGIFARWKYVEITDNGVKKKVVEFTFVEGDEVFKVLPPYDLREKLGQQYVGKKVLIRYMADDARRSSANNNAMKIFGVWVDLKTSEATKPNLAGEYITDDDIPF